MKKVLAMMLAVCAMSVSGTVYAQNVEAIDKPIEKKDMKERRVEIMKNELNLSEEQLVKMKAADEKLEAARENNRQDMKQAAETHRMELKEILTPEQQVKFEEMKKNHPGKKEFRHQGPKKMHAGKEGCGKAEMKCDSLRGKHHKGHMHKGHRHGDMKCDKAQGECQKMKDCDKKQDCPQMKGECQKGKCDKPQGECPKEKK